jgi:hypothetical protein
VNYGITYRQTVWPIPGAGRIELKETDMPATETHVAGMY